MSHTKTKFNIGICSSEYESDLENAYLFGYLCALEDRIDTLEDRSEKIEQVFRDLLDSEDEDDEEVDNDEDEEEAFSHPCCYCRRYA